MEGITFKIEEFIGVIKKESNGWQKELNLVTWGASEADVDAKSARYDIRSWDEGHTKCRKGLTFSPEEMHRVVAMMQGRV